MPHYCDGIHIRIHNCATCAYVLQLLHDIVRPREPANASASRLHTRTNVPKENQWFFSRATSQTFPRTVYSAYTCCLRRPHVTQSHNTFEMDQVRFGPLAVPIEFRTCHLRVCLPWCRNGTSIN